MAHRVLRHLVPQYTILFAEEGLVIGSFDFELLNAMKRTSKHGKLTSPRDLWPRRSSQSMSRVRMAGTYTGHTDGV
jgi:hypothetical protein